MNIQDVSKWRVLIVDDDPDSIMTVKMVLSAAGATIYEADNGLAGFEIFKRERPDLVLSDISMPGMDGWELIKHIRGYETSKHYQATPVLALTAHAMVGDKERILQAGFTGYLSKPLTLFTFLDEVKKRLAKHFA